MRRHFFITYKYENGYSNAVFSTPNEEMFSIKQVAKNIKERVGVTCECIIWFKEISEIEKEQLLGYETTI